MLHIDLLEKWNICLVNASIIETTNILVIIGIFPFLMLIY